jgi:DNA-binding NarL/FixJ family response regulator
LGKAGNPAHTLVFGAGDGKQVTFLNETNERFGILVVDDHPVMRDGLRAVIELEFDMEITGEAADGKEAIEQFRKLLPDVMLIDLQMPVMDGLQAITAIRSEFPDAIIIVLTTFPGDARVVRAFTLGATSYLLKTARREEIVRAIRGALTGRHIVDPEVAQEIASHSGRERLTDREIVVLSLVAQGRSNRDIAEALNITEDTVKARMKSIMAKLGAEDRTHAVMIAMKRGFLDSLP